MNLLFHICGRKRWTGCWSLGLILACALVFPGCKQLGLHDRGLPEDGLRRNDLALPARQVRTKQRLDNGKKSADDAWMSDEAQSVYHDLD
jgi:hypothetical protein